VHMMTVAARPWLRRVLANLPSGLSPFFRST
jgi:hypothetical protein